MAMMWMYRLSSSTWKDKNLDYEIETNFSINITDEFLPWKDKNLDYEIETYQMGVTIYHFYPLKR